MSADDLRAAREAALEVSERIGHVEHAIAEGFRERDRKASRRFKLTVMSLLLVAVTTVGLTWHVWQNRLQLERSNDLQETEQRAACERGNRSTEVDRFIIEGQFEDYNLVAANQTPERQQFLQNRREQRLNRLEELRPIRDCG